MLENLSITKANTNDAKAIHQLIADVLGSYGLHHLRPEGVDDDIDDLDAYYFNNNGFFGVVKNEDEKLIASVAIYKIATGICELRKMYLQVNEQGKGIGKLLLQTAIAKATELGYNKMVLKTNSNLNIAIGLYKKYGFVHSPMAVEDQKADCDVAMELIL